MSKTITCKLFINGYYWQTCAFFFFRIQHRKRWLRYRKHSLASHFPSLAMRNYGKSTWTKGTALSKFLNTYGSDQFMKRNPQNHHFRSWPSQTPPVPLAALSINERNALTRTWPAHKELWAMRIQLTAQQVFNLGESVTSWLCTLTSAGETHLPRPQRAGPPPTTTPSTARLRRTRRLNLNKSPLKDEAEWKLSPVLPFSCLPQGQSQVLTRLI